MGSICCGDCSGGDCFDGRELCRILELIFLNPKYMIMKRQIDLEEDIAKCEPGLMLGGVRDETKYIVLHCSATKPNQSYEVDQLIADHQSNGFYTAGYHFYVRRNGVIWQLRYTDEKGAHVQNHNHNSLGICYEGGISKYNECEDNMTAEQEMAVWWLVNVLNRMYPGTKFLGHRDFAGVKKNCPCLDVKTKFADLCLNLV